jgi:hypothetical protein
VPALTRLEDALADVEKELLARAGQLLELASTARANGRDAYADRLIQLAAELLQRAASIEEQDAGGDVFPISRMA